jgi:hypothetical protein
VRVAPTVAPQHTSIFARIKAARDAAVAAQAAPQPAAKKTK